MQERRVSDYRGLKVWQKGIALAKAVYRLTEEFPSDEQFGLTSQLRRAAVSVPSNIAEGQQRRGPKEFRRFLTIALGSLAEADTQQVIAAELEMVKAGDVVQMEEAIAEIRRMLYGLLSRVARECPGKRQSPSGRERKSAPTL